jgi:hypothetical protein
VDDGRYYGFESTHVCNTPSEYRSALSGRRGGGFGTVSWYKCILCKCPPASLRLGFGQRVSACEPQLHKLWSEVRATNVRALMRAFICSGALESVTCAH